MLLWKLNEFAKNKKPQPPLKLNASDKSRKPLPLLRLNASDRNRKPLPLLKLNASDKNRKPLLLLKLNASDRNRKPLPPLKLKAFVKSKKLSPLLIRLSDRESLMNQQELKQSLRNREPLLRQSSSASSVNVKPESTLEIKGNLLGTTLLKEQEERLKAEIPVAATNQMKLDQLLVK